MKKSIVTLKEAKKGNLEFYYTGIPCKRNHIADRYTKNRVCTICRKLVRPTHTATYRAKHRERLRLQSAEIRAHDPEKVNLCSKISRERALIKYPERVKRQRQEYCALRRARKLQRTPKWVNLTELKKIYLDCPEGMVVDHIIPLKGKLVSGLHVAENLQYLTKYENLSKGNKFAPTFSE